MLLQSGLSGGRGISVDKDIIIRRSSIVPLRFEFRQLTLAGECVNNHVSSLYLMSSREEHVPDEKSTCHSKAEQCLLSP